MKPFEKYIKELYSEMVSDKGESFTQSHIRTMLESTLEKHKLEWKSLGDAFPKDKDKPKLSYSAFREKTVELTDLLYWLVRREKVLCGLYKQEHNTK